MASSGTSAVTPSPPVPATVDPTTQDTTSQQRCDWKKALETVTRVLGGHHPHGYHGRIEVKNLARCFQAQAEALEQIRTVCEDNASATCNQRMALDFVRQVAIAALTGRK